MSNDEVVITQYVHLLTKMSSYLKDVGLHIFCLWSSVRICLVVMEEKKELPEEEKVFQELIRGRSEGKLFL
jgi:hypothetical protein